MLLHCSYIKPKAEALHQSTPLPLTLDINKDSFQFDVPPATPHVFASSIIFSFFLNLFIYFVDKMQKYVPGRAGRDKLEP